MSSAISGSLNLSRAQSQIPIDETGAASNIQNFYTYDAVELIGYVFVNIPGEETDDYRASVKLSIVKNGAGIYEVAASDIAGDDYLGSPIVSFSMSGSLLQATLDSALVAAESPSESYIRYALSAPAVGGQDNISIDASKLIGTIDSGVLPAGQYPGADGSSAISAGYVGEFLSAELTSLQSINTDNTDTDVTGMSIELTPGVWQIGYNMSIGAYNSGTSSYVVSPRIRITDGANSPVSGTTHYNKSTLVGGATEYYTVSCSTVIQVSSTTTYKVRAAKGGTGSRTDTYVRLVGSGANVDSLLSGIDGECFMYAVRIA